MLIKNNFIIDEPFVLYSNCIEVIEKELENFFNMRFSKLENIPELFHKGDIKNAEDILKYLNISEYDIEVVLKSMEHKLISLYSETYSLHKVLSIDSYIKYFKQNLNVDIDDMLNSELMIGYHEILIDEFLSIIYETYYHGKIVNFILQRFNFAEFILGGYSLKSQKHKHGEKLSRQIQGFMINLRSDMRNELVKSTLALLNSFENYYEGSIVA